MSYKQHYFCTLCKKIMRPLDSDMYRRIGRCLDCEAILETHLIATGQQNKLKLFGFLKEQDDLYFNNEDLAMKIMEMITDDKMFLSDDELKKFIIDN